MSAEIVQNKNEAVILEVGNSEAEISSNDCNKFHTLVKKLLDEIEEEKENLDLINGNVDTVKESVKSFILFF